ncbi:MAG: hypothetical protein ABH950_02650 [Candidatus Altiarchaeota archaeon]
MNFFPVRNRAQAAVEYITIYAWAILVVVTMAIVISKLGFLEGPRAPPNYNGFAKLKPQTINTGGKLADPFTMGSWKDTFQFVITNTVGVPVTINSLDIQFRHTGTSCAHTWIQSQSGCETNRNGLPDHGTCKSTPTEDPSCVLPKTVDVGELYVLCGYDCGDSTGAQNEGAYSVFVDVGYDLSIGDIKTTHMEGGNIRGQFE